MDNAAIPAMIIVFLLSSCATTDQLNNTTNVTSNLSNISANETWKNLTALNVEKICLRMARERLGESYYLARGCNCEEMASDGMKQYECIIFSFDPTVTENEFTMVCFLAERTCTIKTDQRSGIIIFEQLQPG
jgi:hypothetical protein